MSLLSSLTNRIFVATALVVVVTSAVTIYRVTNTVTVRAEADLQRGLNEAAALVDQYSRNQFADFLVKSSLIATLPKLVGAAATGDSPTVKPIADEYHRMAAADVFVVLGPGGQVLANVGPVRPGAEELIRIVRDGRQRLDGSSFQLVDGGLIHAVALPLESGTVGTLVVGYSFGDAFARQIKAVTNSDIALVAGSTVVASTLEPARTADLPATDGDSRIFTRRLGDEEFIGRAQPLGGAGDPRALVLQSRTEHLRFLTALRWQVALAGLVAVGLATVVAYGVARTVTRPVRALTATMREITATGDLSRPHTAGGRWDDEDARVLGATFAQLADALDRFRREAAQRERLSSLGRLSAVVAHEIRNPLMIIRSAARSLYSDSAPAVVETAHSIDEEVRRVDRVITGVLDFARPIRFQFVTADLSEICRDAAAAADASAGVEAARVTLELPGEAVPIVTDVDRLRAVLVNVLANAHEAIAGAKVRVPGRVVLSVAFNEGSRRIAISDNGRGIPAADIPRLFEPFFTTRATGSGLGLAIARNIVEGLGGTIVIESQPDTGTRVSMNLPEMPPAAARST
ncbi:MAG TPA: ATP-binding protein [Vicinamibacterales bacterium]|nr:ATP-binding protein [Vicinamibacterales bacterium]